MPRPALVVALLALLGWAATSGGVAEARGARPAATALRPAPALVAFRSSSRFGSRSRGFGFGGLSRGRRRPGLLHRVVRTAIWLYVLHLFFTHGGLSILLWIVIIALVVSLLRRRRRRYAY